MTVINTEYQNYNTLFQKNFMEINILPQEPSSLTSSESQPSFHLHDIPRKMSMTTIDPGNDDWRVHSGLGVDNYGGGQNSGKENFMLLSFIYQ